MSTERDGPEVWVESPDVAYPDPSNVKALHTFTDEELAARDRAVAQQALRDAADARVHQFCDACGHPLDRADTLGEDNT